MPTSVEQPEGKLVLGDARGRITLGPHATGKSYRVYEEEDGQITLVPMVQIPAREMWLFNNLTARNSFDKGIVEMEAGLGREVDYSAFLEDDDAEVAS